MTGLAVVCGTIAWLGLLPVLAVISLAGGTFLGLLLCNYLGLGFAFEDLPWDIAKCFIIAAIAIIPVAIVVRLQLEFFPVYACLMLFFLAYRLSMKFSWLDIEQPEIVICVLAALLLMAAMLSIFAPLLRP